MKKKNRDDFYFMRAAIDEANKAKKKKEVPIGAVAVKNGEIFARAHNIRETTKNPLGHAELLLLEKIFKLKGNKKLSSWRYNEVTVYVTCEPCVMCMGALLQARVKKIVFGCLDAKGGACGSLYDLSNDPRLNHRIEVKSLIMAEECAKLLSDFFRELRNEKKESKNRKAEIKK